VSSFYEDALGGGGNTSGLNLIGAWEFGMKLSEEMRKLMLERIEAQYPEAFADGKPTTETMKMAAPFTALAIAVATLQRWVRQSTKSASGGDANDPFTKVLALVDAALGNDDPAEAIRAMGRVMGRDK
jgi:hypothetical protein